MEVEELKKKIAGEIVLSDSPGETIKKWRQLFQISQVDISNKLEITASVISDYETGRRKSPGIKLIEKIVNALIEIELKRGGKNVAEFASLYKPLDFKSFIILMKDFQKGIKIKSFLRGISGDPCYNFEDTEIFGYSLIDSEKAIVNFSPVELGRVTSLINRHCLIFTNLHRGRSPLVALRLANLKPGLIILHGIKKVDDIALRIAKLENIPLAVSYVATLDNLIKKLENFNSKV